MPETKTLPNGNRKKVSMDLLFGGLAETTDRLSSGTVLPLAHITPDPEQPRKTFPPLSLEELAASIREQGVLQPLMVRPQGRDHYVLIAGERRWRAAQMAGLESVPVVIKDVDGATTRVLSLVENLQREDLRDDEKASALLELKRLRQGTWEDVGRWVGLSVPRVKALAQLVREPAEVTELGLSEKHLSLTRALKDGRRLQLLREVARRALSTQQTREAVELLKNDDAMSVAAALRTVLGAGEGSGAPRTRADRLYACARWLERIEDDDVDDTLLEALAALEKQVRTLRRRLTRE